MPAKFSTIFFKYGAITLILLFATVQFMLILRHKSPYLSDSHFYKHIYYQMKGNSYNLAQQKILAQVDLAGTDDINKNIFTNPKAYENSLTFFIKRPLYPLLANVMDFIVSEYFAFLIPVFLSYIGVVILSFYLLKQGLDHVYAAIGTSMFVAFYPFLDWSTYFMTDTMGAAFWLLQIILIYKYLTLGKLIYLRFYLLAVIISLINREQSILLAPVLFFVLTITKISQELMASQKKLFQITLHTVVIAGAFIAALTLLGQRSIIDTIVYTQNKYGLTNYQFTITETLKFLANELKNAHLAFAKDLYQHHWWFTIFALGVFGIVLSFFQTKKRLLDVILIGSAVASYSAIFIYPVLSYRYFFPVLLSVIYFAMKSLEWFFAQKK